MTVFGTLSYRLVPASSVFLFFALREYNRYSQHPTATEVFYFGSNSEGYSNCVFKKYRVKNVLLIYSLQEKASCRDSSKLFSSLISEAAVYLKIANSAENSLLADPSGQ